MTTTALLYGWECPACDTKVRTDSRDLIEQIPGWHTPTCPARKRVAEMPDARSVRVLPGITVSMTEAQRLRGVPRGDDAA